MAFVRSLLSNFCQRVSTNFSCVFEILTDKKYTKLLVTSIKFAFCARKVMGALFTCASGTLMQMGKKDKGQNKEGF